MAQTTIQRGSAVPGTGSVPNAGNKDMNRLIRKVKKQGAKIVYGGSHVGVKIWHPSGDGPVLLTLTHSGSQRTIKNARAKLRRLGFKL